MLGPGLCWIMGHDQPENGGVGDAHTQQASYAFRATASYQEPEFSDEVGNPHRFPGTGLQILREALSKNAPCTAGIRTAQRAHLQAQYDVPTTTGQVGDGAHVVAVNLELG